MYEAPNSILTLKSDTFSKRIVKMVKYLHEHGDLHFSSLYTQVLRSGTSIAANVGEALFAQTRADFITKLHIATKEANETRKWLTLLLEGELLTKEEYDSMDKDCNEIISILVASLKTSKRNIQQIVK